MPRPRVLHVIESLRPYGAEHGVLNLCVALADRYDAHVVSVYGGALVGRFIARGIPVHTLADESATGHRRLAIAAHFWRAIRRVRPDLVHTHLGYANTLGRLVAHMHGIPTVAHIRGRDGQWGTWPHRLAYRLAAHGRTVVLAVSRGMAEDFLRATGMTAEVVYNAVDDSEFASRRPRDADLRKDLGLSRGTPLVGTVARFSHQKNYPLFLRAASLVCARRPAVRFLAVGGGPLFARAATLRDKLGLRGRVHLLGERQDVPTLLPQLTVFLLTSRWEGLPRAVLEASHSGLPIVATDVMGTNEAVLDGITGFLVPPDDARGIACRVLELLADAGLRREMGGRGREFVRSEFGLGRLAEQLDAVYRALLEGGPDRRGVAGDPDGSRAKR